MAFLICPNCRHLSNSSNCPKCETSTVLDEPGPKLSKAEKRARVREIMEKIKYREHVDRKREGNSKRKEPISPFDTVAIIDDELERLGWAKYRLLNAGCPPGIGERIDALKNLLMTCRKEKNRRNLG